MKKLFVTMAKDTPNPTGLPPEWPVEVREASGNEGDAPIDGQTLMTDEELKRHQSMHREAYDKWSAENKDTAATPVTGKGEENPARDPERMKKFDGFLKQALESGVLIGDKKVSLNNTESLVRLLALSHSKEYLAYPIRIDLGSGEVEIKSAQDLDGVLRTISTTLAQHLSTFARLKSAPEKTPEKKSNGATETSEATRENRPAQGLRPRGALARH